MFNSRFLSIDSDKAKQIRDKYGSPVYIIDEAGLRQRFEDFKIQSRKFYLNSRIAISYKTCGLLGVLKLLHDDGAWAEVVSGDEYDIAIKLGIPHSNIIFNGPVKTDAEIKLCLLNNGLINIDHKDELLRVENICEYNGIKAKIGIRIYFPDIQKTSRFGFIVSPGFSDNAYEITQYIINSRYLEIAGIHSHIGKNISSLQDYRNFSTSLATFADHITSNYNHYLSWINVGGGLPGISPLINTEQHNVTNTLVNIEKYCEHLITPLLPQLEQNNNKTLLFFEPGRTLFEPFGAILATVIGKKPPNTQGISGIILDIGTNSITLCDEYSYPIHVFRNCEDRIKQYVYGSMCKEKDIIHNPVHLPDLGPSDQLMLYGCGGYSQSQSTQFINFRHGVLLWRKNNEIVWLRKPEDIDYISSIHCIPD